MMKNLTGFIRVGACRGTLAPVLFLLAGGVAWAQAGGFTEFDRDVRTGSRWTVDGGMPELVVFQDGRMRLDSTQGDSSQYRYAGLSSTELLGGDFSVELAVAFRRLDHWNGVTLAVAAADGAWSAELSRRQLAPGKNELAWQVSRGPAKEEGAVPETGLAGTLRIVRTGNELAFFWRAAGSAGAWKTLKSGLAVDGGSVRAGIRVASPKDTQIVANLMQYRQRGARPVAAEGYPVYLTARPLADQGRLGGVAAVYSEQATGPAGELTVAPGGCVVYGVRGPLNARGLGLQWRSTGALKVMVTQPGTAESIQLGYTLLWDEPQDGSAVSRTRSIGLEDFLTRWAGRKKELAYTHLSGDNLFFVRFEPAGKQPVSIRDLALLGAPLKPIPPVTAGRRAVARGAAKGGYDLLEWVSPETGGWAAGPLSAGAETVLDGVPFKLCPTAIQSGEAPIGITVNRKAGQFNLAHCSDNPAPGKDWVAALQVVYADRSTEVIFCDVGWNCGTYASATWTGCEAMATWWGPTGHPFAAIQYLPEGTYDTFWKGVYTTRVLNPHPEKTIDRVVLYAPPGAPKYTLLGLTLTPVDRTAVGLVEPGEAAIRPDRPFTADVMLYRPAPAAGEIPGALTVEKENSHISLGDLRLRTAGPFAFGRLRLDPAPATVAPGAVRLVFRSRGAPLAASSLLGWMPAAQPADRPYYLTMIAGGGEPPADFERMRRLGYDATKIHMGWEVEPVPGTFNFGDWRGRFERIHAQGLQVAIRNAIWGEVPFLKDRLAPLITAETGQPAGFDPQDPVFVETMTRYYRAVSAFAKDIPHVISINANYGLRHGCVNHQGGQLLYGPRYAWPNFLTALAKAHSLAEINTKSGLKLKAVSELTPKMVEADHTGWLLGQYLTIWNDRGFQTQRQVNEAIRQAGFKNDLVFNVSMHYQEELWSGSSFVRYLPLAREFSPASPYHETSDRYCLSFFKWLCAARTFGLPYGDEGNRNPPAYEQNLRAYQVMLMMQCKEANYCQWWNGIPGAQNVVMLKPYYQLLFNAAYLPDPVGLAFSSESAPAESMETLAETDTHKSALAHYGLANLFRYANINPDRYVIDRFPETDRHAPPMLVDDVSRHLDPAFGDRLETYIRAGGVFVASAETGRLDNFAFLKRFGLAVTPLPAGRVHVSGTGVTYSPVPVGNQAEIAVKDVGQGKIIVWGAGWSNGDYDLNVPMDDLARWAKTLADNGRFEPLVTCDTPNVNVTPYRAKDGSILTLVYNNRCTAATVTAGLSVTLIPRSAQVVDYGASCLGGASPAAKSGRYWQTRVRLPPFQSTVLRWTVRR
ncbi:MAG: hypothetical protein WC708_02665 [Lentisphaeria bacterium]